MENFSSFLSSSDAQCGFKKGLNCSHAIYTLRNIVDYYVNNGTTINLCTLDISKAFDKVNHHALYLQLIRRHLPVQLLDVIVNLFSQCNSCVKWNDVYSVCFDIAFGVRQGSVLSPILFALYIDDISKLRFSARTCYVIIYADDIMLVAPSILDLERLLHEYEKILEYLDMKINFKKSCCLRIGSRSDVKCAKITSSTGHDIAWVQEMRYLGVYLTQFRSFRCSLDHAKRSFYRAANSIFGKVGRFASEAVILQLIVSKCIPVLLYGLEACTLSKSQITSLDFVINRFYEAVQHEQYRNCQKLPTYFSFKLPSVVLSERTDKLKNNYQTLSLHYFKL